MLMERNKIFLIILDRVTNKEFTKYFRCEFDKEKFKRKLKFSKKLVIIDENDTEEFR